MNHDEQAYKNTDREIWRGKSRAEFGDDDRFYADSLFVPKSEVEALGINCDGTVIVLPIREWHRLARGEKNTTNEQALRDALARGYCHPKNSGKVIDPDLIEAMVEEIKLLAAEPQPRVRLIGENVRIAMDTAIKKRWALLRDSSVVKHYIGETQFQIMADELNALLARLEQKEPSKP